MTSAFKQIRLTKTNLVATGNRLYIGNDAAALVSELELTGTALQGQLGNYYLASNSNEYISSGDVDSISGSLQNNIEASGGYLLNLINASSAGVSSINSESGAMTINGSNGISIATNGTTITVSGVDLVNSGDLTSQLSNYYSTSNPSNYIDASALEGFVNSGNLESTGSALQNQIDLINQFNNSGYITTGDSDLRYYSITNPDEYSTSGNLELTGTALQNQIDGLVIPSVNGLVASGELEATGTALQNQLSSYVELVSQQSFITGILPTGFEEYFIKFPNDFSEIPKIQTTVEVSGDILYGINVRNKSISGFTALFTDDIAESGVYLNVFATIN